MVTSDELLGKTVIGALGNYIGVVSNIEIEADSWQVSHLHIKLSDKAAKEFGLKKPLKSCNIKIPTSLVRNVDVIITLNESAIELKNFISLNCI